MSRFLECLKRANGDEEAALVEFRSLQKRGKRRASTPTTVTQISEAQSCVEPGYGELSMAASCKKEQVDGSREVCPKEVVQKLDGSQGVSNARYSKPLIRRGENVYACWSGGSGLEWFPGSECLVFSPTSNLI